MRLYEFPGTRSARCRWLLQEMEMPFEAVRVELPKGEHRQPPHLSVHPYGKVPALQDGDLTLFESVAICLHLAHKADGAGLLPGDGTRERSLHDQWLFFCTNELEQPLWRMRRHQSLYPEAKRLPAEIELARQDFLAASEVLERELVGKAFLIGERLTVADIVLGYTLQWSTWYDLLADRPELARYLASLVARPAFPTELRRA